MLQDYISKRQVTEQSSQRENLNELIITNRSEELKTHVDLSGLALIFSKEPQS